MELTAEYLKEILEYNPENGVFSWKVRVARKLKVGSVAGSKDKGYIAIKIDRKIYKAHRLAFLYISGQFPPNDVDHINGVRNDNRWCNLREATRQENQRNKLVQSNKQLKVKGVYETKSGKYMARISLNKKIYNLGTYSTPEEASMVYNLFAKELFGEFYRN